MEIQGMEWLSLAARWFHVFTGILWIGTTYYFTWLDHRFTEALAASKDGTYGQVWMVHSGGFYLVEKHKMPPDLNVHKLHWFRYEALLTWLSGFLMLTIVYYMGAGLQDMEKTLLTHGQAVALGVGVLTISWLVYEGIWWLFGKNPLVGAAVSYAVTIATAYGLFQVFSNRAVYLHIGAMFGTLMVSNVWMRILPAQRKMIAATRAGNQPDPTMGARAKARSMHNTYMVVPTVALMISNHYPTLGYGSEHPLLALAGLILVGGVAAKVIYHSSI